MVIDEAMKDEMRVTVIATGFGKAEEKSLARVNKKIAPISFSVRENLKESLRETFGGPLKENQRDDRDIPAFLRKVKARAKVAERYDEIKLAEAPDFSLEDEDRFDVPTFLRKQAD
jgi:hypothetical protein